MIARHGKKRWKAVNWPNGNKDHFKKIQRAARQASLFGRLLMSFLNGRFCLSARVLGRVVDTCTEHTLRNESTIAQRALVTCNAQYGSRVVFLFGENNRVLCVEKDAANKSIATFPVCQGPQEPRWLYERVRPICCSHCERR